MKITELEGNIKKWGEVGKHGLCDRSTDFFNYLLLLEHSLMQYFLSTRGKVEHVYYVKTKKCCVHLLCFSINLDLFELSNSILG